MGTLMRTVAAIGIPSIIVIEGADPWSPKVVRASAGSIAHVSLFQMSWQECVQVTKHVPLYALTPKNGNPLVTAKNMREGFLVIGNEAHGIRQEWLADCTDRIALPMPGNAESLNAAVAGSIALYRAYVP